MSKQKRDAEATKAKIIENSMMLFSKNGFDATTVDEIANVSDVNKALIYYYFKNKAGLYEIVMNEVLSAIYTKVIEANKICKSPIDELEAFIKTYAEFANKQPYFPALLLRELSDNGAHIPEMMFSSMRKLFKLLSEILKKGEEEGVFKNVIPMVIHFMIIGTVNLLVTTAPLRKKAAQMTDEINTCSDCPMDEISDYIFEKIKLMLEVK
ncbi:TetR/AcrR family transcriptional regulator [Sulfurimonas sp. HSL3-2]|uniref:TetR/AcrR family transcriptional regulator n=1 Tax=Hydrocurvibacter mobilis TaxID=3131936 RepID=UPI0031F8F56E